MIRLDVLTSNSDLYRINDFGYILSLAKSSKCQIFAMLKCTNKLYGATSDSCCIHEIDIPFLINSDLVFILNDDAKELIDSFDGDYFIPAMFDNAIIQDIYWNDYSNNNLIRDFFTMEIMKNKNRIPQIPIYNPKYPPSDIKIMQFLTQLEGLFNRIPDVPTPILFTNMESNQYIRKAYDNKISEGRVLCKLFHNDLPILFYFYKGMFSLNKSDTLNIEIRFSVSNPRLFMAVFIPKKKRSPIKNNKYGLPFSEKIYCMYINLI